MNSKHVNLYKYRLGLILKRIETRKKFIKKKREDLIGARIWSVSRDGVISDLYDSAELIVKKLI